MHPRWRGVIYVLFLAGFLISAPMVVLYTAGYRYSQERHGLVRVGLLSVLTVPKAALVSVDGKQKNDTTPILIDNLLPGEHTIEITKTGYHTWKKTLAIEESETTFVNKAVLYADTQPVRITSGTFVDAALDPTGRFVALAKQEIGWVEVWARELAVDSEKLLLRLPEQETQGVTLSWSASGKALLVSEMRAEDDPAWTYTSVDGSARISVHELVSALSDWTETETVEQVSLDPMDDDLLYVRTNSRLLRMSLQDATARMLLEEPVQAIQTEDGLLVLRPVGDLVFLLRIRADLNETPLAFLPQGEYEFLPAPDSLVLLKDKTSSMLVLVETTGEDRPILLNTPAVSQAWNPGSQTMLLYSTGFELHAYDAIQHTDEVITRVSHPISMVLWHQSETSAFYIEGNNLYAIELDRRDGRNLFSIADMDVLADVMITQDQKTAYLVGTRGEETGLFSQRLQTR